MLLVFYVLVIIWVKFLFGMSGREGWMGVFFKLLGCGLIFIWFFGCGLKFEVVVMFIWNGRMVDIIDFLFKM